MLSFTSAIANINEELVRISNQSDKQKKTIAEENLLLIQKNAQDSKAHHYEYLSQLMHARTNQNQEKRAGGKPADGALLFISFSMPDEMILELASEAEKFGISVVLKGLVEGDFRKTFEKIALLHEKENQLNTIISGFLINPIWFEQFEIKSVPTLVVTQRPLECTNQSACKNQPYDAIAGNLKIKKSLQLIAEQGEHMQGLAQKILGGSHV